MRTQQCFPARGRPSDCAPRCSVDGGEGEPQPTGTRVVSVSPGLSASPSRRVSAPEQIEVALGDHLRHPPSQPYRKPRVMLHAWALYRQSSLDTPITSEGTCIHAPGQSWHCLATSLRWPCSSGIFWQTKAPAPPDAHPYHARVETFRKGPSSALCPETGPDSRGGGAGTAS